MCSLMTEYSCTFHNSLHGLSVAIQDDGELMCLTWITPLAYKEEKKKRGRSSTAPDNTGSSRFLFFFSVCYIKRRVPSDCDLTFQYISESAAEQPGTSFITTYIMQDKKKTQRVRENYTGTLTWLCPRISRSTPRDFPTGCLARTCRTDVRSYAGDDRSSCCPKR